MENRFDNSASWVILSPIEQSIKRKIEAVGTPLKDWNVKIYRGILTGYNDAFIIDGAKKDELIAADPKSAEIIRPNNLCYPVFQTIYLLFSFELLSLFHLSDRPYQFVLIALFRMKEDIL